MSYTAHWWLYTVLDARKKSLICEHRSKQAASGLATRARPSALGNVQLSMCTLPVEHVHACRWECSRTLQHVHTFSWACACLQVSIHIPTLQHVHTSSWACAHIQVTMCTYTPVNVYTFSWACACFQLSMHMYTSACAHFKLSMCMLAGEHTHT